MARSERVRSKIPEFETLEEEAAFWDSHSLAEFEDELEPVELEVVLPLRHGITVSLESEAFHRLCALAQKRGMSFISLAETWIIEALDRAEASETTGTEGPGGRTEGVSANVAAQ